MKKIFLVFLFSLSMLVLRAQNILTTPQSANPTTDTLRWNAAGYTDQNTNKVVSKPCQFVSYGNSKIDWVQKSGALIYTLTITNVNGNWTDAGIDGTLTYNVTLDQFTGTVTIARTGENITILLDLTVADRINNLYSISNFDIL